NRFGVQSVFGRRQRVEILAVGIKSLVFQPNLFISLAQTQIRRRIVRIVFRRFFEAADRSVVPFPPQIVAADFYRFGGSWRRKRLGGLGVFRGRRAVLLLGVAAGRDPAADHGHEQDNRKSRLRGRHSKIVYSAERRVNPPPAKRKGRVSV